MGGKLKEIRERMASVGSTQQITKAMKMVSAAKLKKSQEAIQTIRLYAEKLKEVTARIFDAASTIEDFAFTKRRNPKNVIVLCITSDRGLCGAFNTQLIKVTQQHIQTNYSNQKVSIWTIGKKGYEVLCQSDYQVESQFISIAHPFDIEHIYACVDKLIKLYAQEEVDVIDVVYSRFYNAVTHKPTIETLLPIVDQETNKKASKTASSNYIYQQPAKELLQNLFPRMVKTQLLKVILDSIASEHGARMSAMDKATENAKEIQHELKIAYNTARQAAITTELSEIVSGSIAL